MIARTGLTQLPSQLAVQRISGLSTTALYPARRVNLSFAVNRAFKQSWLVLPQQVRSQSVRAMQREKPGPGQESVWDYPRPPKLEKVPERITVELDGKVIADTTGGYRVLETSHPPTYYIPPQDVNKQQLTPVGGNSYCEWKGTASYYNAAGKSKIAWYYPKPTESFKAIAGYICFYPSKVDKATVGGETVTAQPGDFYGGWITSKLVGPFKGSPGTMGW